MGRGGQSRLGRAGGRSCSSSRSQSPPSCSPRQEPRTQTGSTRIRKQTCPIRNEAAMTTAAKYSSI